MCYIEENSKVAYVILHYQVWKETCDCVESLKEIMAKDDIIIVIDNASPNNSGELLQEKYRQDEGVVVIRNRENIGFAKGNNVGYELAKHKYKCDFILLLNNDTLILQKDFRRLMIEAYYKYHYAVMGPKIMQRDGAVNRTNPSKPVHTTLRRARIGQISNCIRYILSFVGLDMCFGRAFDTCSEGKDQSDVYQEDIQISGAGMIFSKEYISKFDGLNSKTFMYLEEILLYIRVKKAGMKIIYNPELELIHLEDAATLETFKGKTAKTRRFKYRCQMRSFKVLIDELKIG